MRALHEAGLPLELHHDGWQDLPDLAGLARPTPGLGAFYRVIRSSMVNLSLAADWLDHPYRGIKGLNLEIASAGGAQISTPADELDDLFEVGQDVLTAQTPADFVAVARDLLRQPERARQLGRNSRAAMIRHGGWEVWWQRVAGLLSDVGVSLDLAGEAVQPDPGDTGWLATAMTAVGHGYEKQGQKALAAVYYGMVLGWQPDDYAANTGLARLATTAEGALPYWPPALLPCPLGMPGIGATNSTHYRFDAAANWLRSELAGGDPDGALAALAICAPFDVQMAPIVADHLFARGQAAQALEAVDIGLRHWPNILDLQEMRQKLQQIIASPVRPPLP
jgi:hypothetical protein